MRPTLNLLPPAPAIQKKIQKYFNIVFKMSSIWKLVEAELSPEAKAKLELADLASGKQSNGAATGKQRRPNNGGSTKRNNHRRQQQMDTMFYADTPESRAYYGKLAVEQM